MVNGPTVLCVGSATCVHDDLRASADLFTPDMVVAVNHMGRDWPDPFDHWVSFHAELLPKWSAERARAGLPAPGAYWTAQRRLPQLELPVQQAANWGGSSGLLAVTVAVTKLGARRVVLAGIPLDINQGHYDSPDEPWRDGGNYRRAWIAHKAELVNVRSLSGWTRDLLGAATKEWLDG